MLLAGTIILVQDRYLVLTPEKVVVSYELAGLGPRIGAHLIDLLIFGVIFYALAIGIGLSAAVFGAFSEFILAILAVFGIFLYFILLEGLFQGQTLGKKLMNLRVISEDGTPITMRGAILRNLIRPGDFLPSFYLIGFLCLFVNAKAQRLGDMTAGTVVVKEIRSGTHYAASPHRVGIHPLEHTVGELSGMTLEEYHAIKRLCDRFPYLTQKEQAESIAEIWIPFAEQMKIVPEPTVHPIYQMEAAVMKYGRVHKLV